LLPYYYAKTVFGVTVALLDQYSGLTVNRFDSTSANSIVKTINVPLTFGPMEKAYQFRKELDSGQRYYLQLPRMALVFNGITFAADRAKSLEEQREWLNEYVNITGVASNTLFEDFQPTPWDFHFTLFIRTEFMEDFSQIIENILPYYAPKSFLRVKEFSFLNIERDLPVLMGGVNTDFSDDVDETQQREINGNIDLTVEGQLYKPVSAAKIVKTIKSQYFIGNNNVFVHSYDISGFNATSAVPTSGWDTSGYNIDTNVYWTQTMTSAGDL
jgi:hypothetical protein